MYYRELDLYYVRISEIANANLRKSGRETKDSPLDLFMNEGERGDQAFPGAPRPRNE